MARHYADGDRKVGCGLEVEDDILKSNWLNWMVWGGGLTTWGEVLWIRITSRPMVGRRLYFDVGYLTHLPSFSLRIFLLWLLSLCFQVRVEQSVNCSSPVAFHGSGIGGSHCPVPLFCAFL